MLLVSILAIACYLVATILLIKRLRTQEQGGKHLILTMGLIAVVLHGYALHFALNTTAGLDFGFTNVLSLASWFICGLLMIAVMRNPVENLGSIVFPMGLASLALQQWMPTTHIINAAETPGIHIHILFSILAYSLLALAAVQAVLLSIQEKQLHNRHPGGFIRALPPLETMEHLLFQMIIIGFVLHSMSLMSGIFYLDDMFAQHLVHKTILSFLAWGLFAILLIGRWKYGWRGRTAVRWTLSGFVTLLLAYFGSKYVLEIILA